MLNVCLKCDERFQALSKWNRICQNCTEENDAISYIYKVHLPVSVKGRGFKNEAEIMKYIEQEYTNE